MTISQATIFGGSGFIGRYVVERLAKAGARVIVGVRHPERAGFLRTTGDVGQVLPIAVDIGNAAAVAAAVDRSDLIVNMVGILSETARRSFADVHVQGARHVAEAAAQAGAAQLVHLSALGADPNSPAAYGRSKAAGEIAVRSAFPHAVILRPSAVFGVEDDFLNRFAALARIVPALPLVRGGRTRFQPVHVEDVAEAVLRAAGRAESAGRSHELGGPAIYTFRDLLQFVLDVTGRQRFLVPVPTALLSFKAMFLELLPEPPLTRDQIAMLASDNIVSADPDIVRFSDLGISPAALEAVAPDYLARYRRRRLRAEFSPGA